MKIRIIGAVAAGTSAATKARRNNEEADIVIYERDTDISYSGCGLPYFIGEEIESMEVLTPRDPSFFKNEHNVDVKIGHEVLSIDAENKRLEVKNLETDEIFTDSYDKLVFASGASTFIPPLEGRQQDHVFGLRNPRDARAIKKYIDTHQPKKAVIVGTGFIGLELLENLVHLNIDTTLVELMPKITPNLDEDMAKLLESKLEEKGVKILKETSIQTIAKDRVTLQNGDELEADIVLIATGVRPNTQLAQEIGVEIGPTRAIKVKSRMETNIKDIYACGDVAETFNLITGKPHWRPLGSTANKMGRICGDVMTGGNLEFKGNLGTGIYRVFDISIGSSGLSEKEARELGYDIEIIHNSKEDRPTYMGGQRMVIKAIADKATHTLLGVQIVGYEGVDKRLDVLITLMTYRVPVEDFFHIDLGYAPPFSTTKDPVHYTGMIFSNILNKELPLINCADLADCKDRVTLIDTRSKQDVEKHGMIDNAQHIPLAELREMCKHLDPDQHIVVYCNSGTTGNIAQNLLKNSGFKEVSNLSGGHSLYKVVTNGSHQ